MKDTYLIALGAFLLGMMLAKDKGGSKSPTVHNEVTAKGDWWTYPGMWSAG